MHGPQLGPFFKTDLLTPAPTNMVGFLLPLLRHNPPASPPSRHENPTLIVLIATANVTGEISTSQRLRHPIHHAKNQLFAPLRRGGPVPVVPNKRHRPSPVVCRVRRLRLTSGSLESFRIEAASERRGSLQRTGQIPGNRHQNAWRGVGVLMRRTGPGRSALRTGTLTKRTGTLTNPNEERRATADCRRHAACGLAAMWL